MLGVVLPCFLRPNTQAIATCDVWKSRALSEKDLAKAEHAYTDFRELLARDDIDAVVIATPEHWHVPICIAAAQAGKDMFCEKPLGTTVAEGRVLCGAIKRYDRIFQFGTGQRFDYNFRHTCELIFNGRIGELKRITVTVPTHKGHRKYGGSPAPPGPAPEGFDYDMWLGPAPWIPYVGQDDGCWGRMPDYAQGFLTNWGVHHVDIAQWANGSELSGPVFFEGQATFSKEALCNTADEWHGICTYANGLELHHFNGPESVLFEGTEGTIKVGRRALSTTPASLKTAVIGPTEIKLRISDPVANLTDCMKSRSETVCPVEVAQRSSTISLLCDIAMRLERKLKWDPDTETFPGDDEANRMLSRAMRAPWRI